MIKYDYEKSKKCKIGRYSSEMGRSSVEIQCPHCDAEFTAYKWSLAGSGKCCPRCGAKHFSTGMAIPRVTA